MTTAEQLSYPGANDVAYARDRSLYGTQRHVLADEDVTLDDALERCGLDWTVGTRPLYVDPNPDGDDLLEPIRYVAMMREDTRAVLGVARPGFTPIQNREALGVVADLIGAGCTIDTLGSMGGGKRVFASINLPDNKTKIAGEDVKRLIVLQNGHDGGSAYKLTRTNVRFACTNQLPGLFRGAEKRGDVVYARHSAGSIAKLAASVADLLGYCARQDELERATYEDLARRTLGANDLTRLLRALWPDENIEGRALANLERRDAAVRDILAADHNANIAASWWGAYNAVVEYGDWHRNDPRDGDRFRRNLDEAEQRRGVLRHVCALSGAPLAG